MSKVEIRPTDLPKMFAIGEEVYGYVSRRDVPGRKSVMVFSCRRLESKPGEVKHAKSAVFERAAAQLAQEQSASQGAQAAQQGAELAAVGEGWVEDDADLDENEFGEDDEDEVDADVAGASGAGGSASSASSLPASVAQTRMLDRIATLMLNVPLARLLPGQMELVAALKGYGPQGMDLVKSVLRQYRATLDQMQDVARKVFRSLPWETVGTDAQATVAKTFGL